MKKILFLISLIAVVSVNTFAGNLKAYFTYSTFNSPNAGPYIETYLSVIGNSAHYTLNENNKLQSSIEVTLVFKQSDTVKTFKKYNLLSPELLDSLTPKVNFMDQQRISLPNGKYEFEITLKDINSDEAPFKSTQILDINYPTDKIIVSDIELIESLSETKTKSIISKSGYDIIPYTSDFYPEDFDKIAFYAELYNSDKLLGANEPFLMNCYIESQETGKIVGNYRTFSREAAKPVNVILNSFTIEKLPSGNYNLVIEAKSKTNEVLTQKKVFFQRSNPEATPLLVSDEYLNSFVDNMSKEDVEESIKSIEPISTQVEIDYASNQLKGKDEDMMKQYFFNFWTTRNSADPEREWNKYLEQVKITNKLFSSPHKKGYKTDRGRVFLKHGKPNTRSEFVSEPNSYPYEIWHYYKIDQFSNKRFVFYDPDLGTNEYPLLHSDMIGYFNYPQWRVKLHKRTNQPIDMDTEYQENHYGSRANDYFNNPR